MAAYVLRRTFFAIFVLWGVITLIFIVVRMAPGDPVAVMLGPGATHEQIARLRESYGLNEPILTQYWLYFLNVLQLDFGESFLTGRSAVEALTSRIGASARLGLAAMGFTVLVVFPLGILAALKARRTVDRVITSGSLVGQSLPDFWVGIMLMLVFSRWLGWLPSVGASSWRNYLMPAFALSLPFLSVLVRLVRSGLLDVMNEGYVQTARAKGFTERVVISVHAVRNMMIPVVTVAGLQFGSLLSGTVIVETVFSWPGVGRLLVDSIMARDFAVVQATVAFIAAVFVFVNLAVDVLYGYLDPRVRISG